MHLVLKLRMDVSAALNSSGDRANPAAFKLRLLDDALLSALEFWFTPGALRLRRVTFDTASGTMLEKVRSFLHGHGRVPPLRPPSQVAAAERVHPIAGIEDLKQRLGNGRRCFSLEHFLLPDEPLFVLHVALTPELAPSLAYIDAATGGEGAEARASCAMFYSISRACDALAVRVLGPGLGWGA